jgi:hypothetical protein
MSSSRERSAEDTAASPHIRRALLAALDPFALEAANSLVIEAVDESMYQLVKGSSFDQLMIP